MKRTLLSTMVAVLALTGIHAQVTETINENGFAYDPVELTVNLGDTVVFNGSDFHPVLEVSEATWTDKGTTPLEGGFDFPSGIGKVTFEEAGVYYYVCTSHVNSHNMRGKIIVTAPSAVSDITGNINFSVYPVPLTGSILNITFKNQVQKNLSVSVYDVAGNLRISSNGSTTNGHYAIDCSNLPTGLFLMKLSSDEGNRYTKFVRQ